MGAFFVMTLTLPMPIFEKMSLQEALEKFDKNWVYHKKSFLCDTQSLTDFYRAHHRNIFSKIGMGNVRRMSKKCPQLTSIRTPTTLSIKVDNTV